MNKKKLFTWIGLGIAATALLFTNDKVRKETLKVVDKAKDFFKK